MEVKKLEELSEDEELIVKAAVENRKDAYAPYSGFPVGAALMACGDRDTILDGHNVEDAAWGGTHAEETAIEGMVRCFGPNPRPHIDVIAVALEAADGLHAFPCGKCRQKIREFGGESTVILGARLNPDGSVRDVQCSTLGELLPFSFGPENLGK